MSNNIRVLFSCTGVGVVNRGIESFFREAFDGLKNLPGIEAKLVVGKGPKGKDEVTIPHLSRYSKTARFFATLTGRSAYAIEQISTVPAIIAEIRLFKPHVIFSSEANLFFLLYRLRPLIGVPYKLLFSNGGPCAPPFAWADSVHQVAPLYLQEAINAGEPAGKHFLVPYGVHVPPDAGCCTIAEKQALRQNLHLPVNRQIVLSVGWISALHKRMDYTINEVAAIPEKERPFLLLVGNIDEASNEIFALATLKLCPCDYAIRSVPYVEVSQFYKAADVFVLSSLKEGFGRVYLEALMYGLPVIAHQHPVMQYVIGDAGTLMDLTIAGALSHALRQQLLALPATTAGKQHVQQHFAWPVLAPHYRNMFIEAASGTLAPVGVNFSPAH